MTSSGHPRDEEGAELIEPPDGEDGEPAAVADAVLGGRVDDDDDLAHLGGELARRRAAGRGGAGADR